jgi:hypothetical protein
MSSGNRIVPVMSIVAFQTGFSDGAGVTLIQSRGPITITRPGLGRLLFEAPFPSAAFGQPGFATFFPEFQAFVVSGGVPKLAISRVFNVSVSPATQWEAQMFDPADSITLLDAANFFAWWWKLE